MNALILQIQWQISIFKSLDLSSTYDAVDGSLLLKMFLHITSLTSYLFPLFFLIICAFLMLLMTIPPSLTDLLMLKFPSSYYLPSFLYILFWGSYLALCIKYHLYIDNRQHLISNVDLNMSKRHLYIVSGTSQSS